jgi:UDP:flavonoid glycosyltransferase YjiC (YdhE family)
VRLLFTTVPSSGHYHQLIPIAAAAQAAGHEVAFACSGPLRAAFEAMGFPTFAGGIGPDGDQDEEFNEIKRRARELPPGPELDRIGTVDVIFGVRARRLVTDLETICRRWKAHVIVHDFYEAAGAVVAKALGLPHVSVEITPLYDIRPMRDGILKQINRACESVGTAPADDLGVLYGDVHLCFAPPSLLDPQMPAPVSMRTLRPTFFDTSGVEQLPGWVSQMPDQPTVYITAGTLACRWRPGVFPALMGDIISGLRGERLNVVATVGRSQDPAKLGPQPANVHVERYVPHTLMLPHCDIAFTHGGMSCMMGAIEAGLPQVLVPLLVDDPFNAKRCADLGLSLPIPPETLTPRDAREAVLAVLADSSYREKTEKVRDEMHNLPGPEFSVELIEALAS